LEILKPTILKHSKKAKVVPIVFTQTELQESADVFPLEFLDMKYPHNVLFGEDVINRIKFDKKHVRRQLEYELRSKLIHLRENYIRIKKPKELKELLKSAVPTLMPLFYGMLFLKDIEPPTDLDSLFDNIHQNYKVNMSLFKELKQDKLDEQQLPEYTNRLMDLLGILINIIDKMVIK